jgi:hypothetical protein
VDRVNGPEGASQRPCLACGDPRPDAACGPADEVCTEAWEMRHELGDHRRCERFGWACPTAEAHPATRAAGMAALARTGRCLAVVCLACRDDDGPRVVATMGDGLWSAKGSRNAHARRHGLGVQEQKGTVYVVNDVGDFL